MKTQKQTLIRLLSLTLAWSITLAPLAQAQAPAQQRPLGAAEMPQAPRPPANVPNAQQQQKKRLNWLCEGKKDVEADENFVRQLKSVLSRASVHHGKLIDVQGVPIQKSREDVLTWVEIMMKTHPASEGKKSIDGICELDRKTTAEAQRFFFESNLDKLTARGVSNEVCGPVQELEQNYYKIWDKAREWNAKAEQLLKGHQSKDGNSPGLWDRYYVGSNKNWKDVKSYQVSPETFKEAGGEALGAKDMRRSQGLMTEYQSIWGASPPPSPTSAEAFKKEIDEQKGSALHHKLLSLAVHERNRAGLLQRDLEKRLQDIRGRFNRCLTGKRNDIQIQKVTGGKNQPVPHAPAAGRPDPTISGGDEKKDGSPDVAAAVTDPNKDKDNTGGSQAPPVRQNTNQWNSDVDTAGTGGGPTVPGSAPPSDNSTTSFLGNNSGILGTVLIGGAVAGAGYWGYTKYKDKDKEAEEWQARALAAEKKNKNGDGEDDDGDGTSQTRRLVILSPISNAIVAANLPGIQVRVEDTSNGNAVVVTNEIHAITVSCATPSPCSLTGTMTVNTENGVATFSDLKFTEPHGGVRLRFETSFASRENDVGFDVVGGQGGRE